MASDVLYGQVVFKPYFDMQKFEDRIYNKTATRERRINTRKRLKVVDKFIAMLIIFAAIASIAISIAILYRTVVNRSKDNYIKRLETELERKRYDNENVVSSLKTEMKFDDIKMKAYMELNMITPTEKNIIRFNKSDNGFVRQYENIR